MYNIVNQLENAKLYKNGLFLACFSEKGLKTILFTVATTAN